MFGQRSQRLYCENAEGFWIAEPLNALSCLAFFIAVAYLWPRVQGIPLARVLTLNVLVLGCISTLAHMFQDRLLVSLTFVLAGTLILGVFFALIRDVMELPNFLAFFGTLMVIPYVIGAMALFDLVPGLGVSSVYGPVALLFAGFGYVFRNDAKDMSWRLFVAAAMLLMALPLRAWDMLYCDIFPMGTHFLWHFLVAALMTWVIDAYRRHMLAGGARQG